MKEEDIKLLERIRSHLYFSPAGIQTIYKSESQSLREAADRAEEKEKDLRDFDDLISRLNV